MSRRTASFRRRQPRQATRDCLSLTAVAGLLLSQVRLSRHDVSAGLVWVLRCLLAGRALPGQAGSGRFLVALDLSANGLPAGVLPDDFTGNCAQPLDVSVPLAWGQGDPLSAQAAREEAGLGEAGARPLAEGWARAAAAVRCALTAYRADPSNAVRHLLCCSRRTPTPGSWAKGPLGGLAAAQAALPLVGYTTSCLHVPLGKLDCGTGQPVALSYSTLPFRSANGLLFGSVAPGPGGDGILLLLAATAAQAEALAGAGEAARALQALVPGARVLLAAREQQRQGGGEPPAAGPLTSDALASAADCVASGILPTGATAAASAAAAADGFGTGGGEVMRAEQGSNRP